MPSWFIVWGVILNLAGLLLLVREAGLPATEVSWPRLIIYAGMMGGPFAAYADRVRTATTQVRKAVHDASHESAP